SVVARARAANTKPQGALHADRCARTCRWVVPPATLFLPEPLAVAAQKGSSGVPPAGTQRVLERAAGFVLRDGSAARVVALLDRPEAVQPAEGVVDPVVYRDERRGRLGAGGRRGGYGEDQYGQQVRETQADAASSRERDGTGRGCRSAGTNTDTSVPVFTRRSRHRGRTRRCCASRGVRCAGSSPPTSPGGDGGRETPRVNVLHQRDVGTAGGRAGDGEWGGGEARVETGKCRPSLSGTRPASTAPWRVPDSHSRAASECDRLRARSVACRGHRAIRPTLRRIGRSPRI